MQSTLPVVGDVVAAVRGARLADGVAVDVDLEAGTVVAVRPASDRGEFDGWFVLPAAAEPHAHLDKAFSLAAAGSACGDLAAAVDAWAALVPQLTEGDVVVRAERALATYLAHGTTAVRSHVDLLPGPDPLLGLRALVEVRNRTRDVLDLQLAVLCWHWDTDDTIRAALAAGADVLGGVPHLAPDPDAETARLVALAREGGVPLDLHTDERLDADSLSLRTLARAVRDGASLPGVTASHCVSLSLLPPDELDAVAAEVVAAGIGLVGLPLTNLYLQSRGTQPAVRGILPFGRLIAAGVTVAAGGDNVRDPFNPVGRGDPFETTSLLIAAAHLDPVAALHAVTDAARAVLGLPPAVPAPGQAADLLLVRADTLLDVLAGAATERIVLHRGRVVARTTITSTTALSRETT